GARAVVAGSAIAAPRRRPVVGVGERRGGGQRTCGPNLGGGRSKHLAGHSRTVAGVRGLSRDQAGPREESGKGTKNTDAHGKPPFVTVPSDRLGYEDCFPFPVGSPGRVAVVMLIHPCMVIGTTSAIGLAPICGLHG